MKLTTEEIKFIDTYLKNSGVRYADIRFEMTDHVAAALEEQDGDFHEEFRRYMVYNKTELLASNRTFKKLARVKAWHVIKNNFLSLHFWVITFAIFACVMAISFNVENDHLADTMHMILMISSTPVYFYFLYYTLFKKNVNSVIDMLLTIIYFGSVIFRLDRLAESNYTLLLFYFSFSIAFMLLLMKSLWDLNKRYKLKYNG